MDRRSKGMVGASAAIAMLGLGVSAHADVAQFSDSVTVFDSTGAVVVSVGIPDSLEDGLTIVTVPIGIDASQYGNATNLVEPGHPANGFSDVVGICGCGVGGALALGFVSDTENTPVNFGGFPRTFVENGPIDITLYLDTGLQAQGYTAQFASDSEVPEPATWALMLTGFGLAGAGLRRRSPVRATA